MFKWGTEQLETVLGKTVTGIIGVFALGAFAMWAMPKYVVTTENFKLKILSVSNDMNKGDNKLEKKIERFDKLQGLNLIKLKKDFCSEKQWSLDIAIEEREKQDKEPTARQTNRMENIIRELEELNEDEKEIKESLK